MKITAMPGSMKLGILAALLSGAVLQADAAEAAQGAAAAGAAEQAQATLPAIEVVSTSLDDPKGPGEGYVAKRSTTGSKTDSAVVDNPQSISTVTRDQMTDQAAQTVDQALRYTPGVYTQDGTDIRFDQLRARGFDMDSYMDGLSLFQSPRFATPRIDPYLMDRIDVLYGPSSVLYGQGNPGGMVNYMSKLPTETPYHEITTMIGNHSNYQMGFDFSGPVDDNGKVLYRVTGIGRDANTQTSDIKDRRVAIAPSLTIRPDRDTTLTLQGGYQRDPNGGLFNPVPASGTIFSNPNGQFNASQYYGNPDTDHMSRTQYWLGYQFEHRFNDIWSVSQNLRYLHIDENYYQTSVTSPFAADNRTVYMWGNADNEHWNQLGVDTHAQAKFATGDVSHTFLAGVDYRRVSGIDNMGNALVGQLDLYAPNYAALSTVVPNTPVNYSLTQTGVYAQDEMRYRNWVLTAGIREDSATTNQNMNTTGTVQNAQNHAFTWRAGLAYEFANGIVPYVSYATSFEPLLGSTSGGSAFVPTTGKQYEVGVRFQPKGHQSYLRLSAFDLRQDNVATPDPSNALYSIQAGQVRSRGIEAEAHANVTDNFKMIASYAYLDQKVTKGTTLVGSTPASVPRHSASLWGDYTIHGGPLDNLGFGAGVRYVGSTEGASDDSFQVPGRTLVDAAVHYDLQHWRFAVNASNLFNRQYISYCSSTLFCYWGASRSVVATATYHW